MPVFLSKQSVTFNCTAEQNSIFDLCVNTKHLMLIHSFLFAFPITCFLTFCCGYDIWTPYRTLIVFEAPFRCINRHFYFMLLWVGARDNLKDFTVHLSWWCYTYCRVSRCIFL